MVTSGKRYIVTLYVHDVRSIGVHDVTEYSLRFDDHDSISVEICLKLIPSRINSEAVPELCGVSNHCRLRFVNSRLSITLTYVLLKCKICQPPP
jgi:hypothetical protein